MARRFLSAIKLLTGSTPPAGTVGDTFFDTDTKTIQVHDGTNWVNSSIRPTDGAAGGRVFTGDTSPTSPVVGDLWVDGDTKSAANGSFVRWQIFATAGQTTLSGNDVNGIALSYVVGYEQVYINGALQYRGQDYTATTGTTVTGISALLDGDVVEVLVLTSIILPAYTSYSSTAPASPAVGQLWVDTSQAVNDTASYVIASTLTNSFRNVLINGEMEIDQRNGGASQTITAGAALAYTIDRWYGYCTGANITGQRIGGSAPNIFQYRFTGATSNTAVGFGQRIESSNSYHLAGQQVSLSAFISSSSLTSLTWTAFYANTADTFGSLASPTRTQIATGTFTISSALAQKTATFTIPSAATTGIEIVFTGGALLGSQTLVFTAAQLELGTVVTPFERRPIGTELALCKRYYQRYNGAVGCGLTGIASSSTGLIMNFSLNVDMRIAPSLSGSGQIWISDQYVTDQSAASVSATTPQGTNTSGGRLTLGGFSGLTTGRYYSTPASNIGSGFIDFSAEL